jgi:HSP20 family protein
MAFATTKNRLRSAGPAVWGDLNTVFDQFFNQGGGVQAFYVPASVWEDADSYHVELDVPGVTRDHVDVTFEKGTLRVTTERLSPEENRTSLVDERRYGKVTRTVALPETIDPESIAAELTDGVLHVTVAKKPESQPKRIEIK